MLLRLPRLNRTMPKHLALNLRCMSMQGSKSTMFTSGDPRLPYVERQERLGRPVSPHLTIYAQPIEAVSSITQRVTGVALAVGLSGAGTAALLGQDVPALIFKAQETIPAFIYISKFAVAFPFGYHWLSGLRHYVWDSKPELINLRDAPKMTYSLFGMAIVFALLATTYTIQRPEDEEKKITE